jgi:hypothetical protein
MYSRSYTDGEIIIPEKYSGTALEEIEKDKESDTKKSECEDMHMNNAPCGEIKKDKINLSGMTDIVKCIFGNHDDKENFLSGIGFEEILILGMAIYLFFSKRSDKECALILLALLFIK